MADRESLYLLTTNLVLWIILIIGSTPLTDVRYQHMLRQKKWNTTLLNGIVYAVLFILCIAYHSDQRHIIRSCISDFRSKNETVKKKMGKKKRSA